MEHAQKKRIFTTLKALLKKHAKGGLVLKSGNIGSTAKVKKPQFHIYGTKDVSILGLPKRPTFVVGIIEQKHFVGFYSMPMYSHPRALPLVAPELKRARKGKSCLNITVLSPAILRELDALVRKGILLYKKEGWI